MSLRPGMAPPKVLWQEHPDVRTGPELTMGERAADAVRNGMGSWVFVFCFSLAMALWMGLNGEHGLDPFPFILLNLMLSTLAALQGAILLIAAKRADQIAAELALADYRIGVEDHAMDAEALALIKELCRSLGVDVPSDHEHHYDHHHHEKQHGLDHEAME
jgi:uncharacterized membrane protein